MQETQTQTGDELLALLIEHSTTKQTADQQKSEIWPQPVPCVSRSAHRLAIGILRPGSVFAREGDLPGKRRDSPGTRCTTAAELPAPPDDPRVERSLILIRQLVCKSARGVCIPSLIRIPSLASPVPSFQWGAAHPIDRHGASQRARR